MKDCDDRRWAGDIRLVWDCMSVARVIVHILVHVCIATECEHHRVLVHSVARCGQGEQT